MSLADRGCSEMGLTHTTANEFLELLQENGVLVLGMDPWRKVGDTYCLNAVEVWAAPKGGVEERIREAKAYLGKLDLSTKDLVTVQF